MADHLTSQARQPDYQTPEWETPVQSKRRSLLDRFIPSGSARANPHGTEEHREQAPLKEAPAATSLPDYSPHAQNGPKPTEATSQPRGSRLDAVLPPHRKYFGRSRRFLLLFVILPLAVLLLIILPLAIGLGVGLSHRSSGSQNLALPTNTGIFTGELTYYAPGLGACGKDSTDQDAIVAVSHILFDAASTSSNPNANPLCAKKIRIQRNFVEKGAGNRSVDVTVVDRCTGCKETDLDVSMSIFEQLALETSGRVVASWAWLP